jgi:LCP family protein required for cell wall assembly
VDRRYTVGNSSPSQPSQPLRPSGDQRVGDPYARRERSRDTYRGNERESAYRGRGPTYGRRDGEVRGPGDGGSVIHGPGRFGPPVDPWDESRAVTETWFTIATHSPRPASRSDVVLRLNTSEVPSHEDTAAQDTVADLFEHSDPGSTDEIAVPAAAPAVLRASSDRLWARPAVLRAAPEVDQPPWTPSDATDTGTVYRSAITMATFVPSAVDESRRDTVRRHARRLGWPQHVRPRWLGLRRGEREWTRSTDHRSPLWARMLITLGALIMVAGIGAIIVVKIGLSQVSHAIPTENLLGEMAAKPAVAAAGPSIAGPINFLLVGVDTRPSGDTGSHSDTIIIAHIPATHDRVYLVSIPRDTSTIIPSDPKTRFAGGSYKINAAFTFGSWHGGGDAGGFQLLAGTIKNAYGITFNGGAIVNFSGFTDIINKLGGVNMFVDETTVSIHRGTDSNRKFAKPYDINPDTGVPICANRNVTFDANPLACALPGVTPVVYKKGQRHLSAADALDFVRSRDGLVGTDYARQRHQQQFIKAVLAEVYQKGLSDPLEMGTFAKSVGKAFVFDGGGVSLTDWLFALKGITPGSMVTIKTNDGQFVGYVGKAPDARQSLNATSLELLAAVRDDRTKTDTVGQFVAAHPDWVAPS